MIVASALLIAADPTAAPDLATKPRMVVELDNFRVTADEVYIGNGLYDNTFVLPTGRNENHVPARVFSNLQFSYSLPGFGKRREVFFNVANVFDTKPPSTFTYSNGPNYNRVGRNFRVGLRFVI